MFFSSAAEIGIWWRGGGDEGLLVEPSLQPQVWSRACGKQAEVTSEVVGEALGGCVLATPTRQEDTAPDPHPPQML